MSGEQLKTDGMRRALEASLSWRDKALRELYKFAQGRKKAFACEEFRMHWFSRGLPNPRSHNCWGALMMAAQKAGLVCHTGEFRKAWSARTHAHRVGLWRAR